MVTVVALGARVEDPHVERHRPPAMIALTSAPVTPSACPVGGPGRGGTPASGDEERQEGVVDDGVGVAPAQVHGEARLDPVLRLRSLHRA